MSSIAYTVLQEIASFYDLNFEDLKAEMHVFCNYVHEKE